MLCWLDLFGALAHKLIPWMLTAILKITKSHQIFGLVLTTSKMAKYHTPPWWYTSVRYPGSITHLHPVTFFTQISHPPPKTHSTYKTGICETGGWLFSSETGCCANMSRELAEKCGIYQHDLRQSTVLWSINCSCWHIPGLCGHRNVQKAGDRPTYPVAILCFDKKNKHKCLLELG